MDASALVEVGFEAAAAARRALDDLADWGPVPTRRGQYKLDLAADHAVLGVLHQAGLGSLSEESGRHHPDRSLVAVVDPVDGSTNAFRRIPWYATSVCVLDGDGPLASVVVNLASGARFWAMRGGGAFGDDGPLRPRATTELDRAIVALSGLPPVPLGWCQTRAMGACALDLCGVASGLFDGYFDATRPAAHGPWDYLGGLQVCREAGAVVADARDEEMVVVDHDARRSPVAAATGELLGKLVQLIG
ncbi:MAG TPA: inositol monophosphatase [Acidimicrobiales bacterium]|nr:inositol monophosphatase [Acidimicrobiales bacterium]